MHDYMMMIMGVAIGRKSELIQFEFRPTEFFFCRLPCILWLSGSNSTRSSATNGFRRIRTRGGTICVRILFIPTHQSGANVMRHSW